MSVVWRYIKYDVVYTIKYVQRYTGVVTVIEEGRVLVRQIPIADVRACVCVVCPCKIVSMPRYMRILIFE